MNPQLTDRQIDVIFKTLYGNHKLNDVMAKVLSEEKAKRKLIGK